MKKSISLVVTLFIMGTSLTNCNSPAEKVEDAKNNVVDAQVALDKANTELLDEVENYKKEMAERVAANNLVIAELKSTMKDVKDGVVENFELKNKDLQTKMEVYKVEGKDKWEAFKLEFEHDMNELAKAMAALKMKNVK